MPIPWCRSWPPAIPFGAPHVVDAIPRYPVEHNAYGVCLASMLRNWPQGFVCIEWDIAISVEDMARFERAIARAPDLIHVAPYLMFFSEGRLTAPATAHRKMNVPNWIPWDETDDYADAVGFGCIWIPPRLLAHAIETGAALTWTYPSADTLASDWFRQQRVKMHVVRDVHLVHLHQNLRWRPKV